MTTNIQQGTLLDVLKKKMRQTKEEMEKYKDECEEYQKRLQGEVIRREEVSWFFFSSANKTTNFPKKNSSNFDPKSGDNWFYYANYLISDNFIDLRLQIVKHF